MGRNVIVCCDGTGNQYGPNNTNVVKLFEAAVKDAQQLAYYDPGVGTFSSQAAIGPISRSVSRLMGKAFASGLTRNIEDAYEYLMDHHEPDDRLFLFGFSRGAFTVRALAGMLHKCGLLQKGSRNLIPYASRMYRHGDDELAKGFKAAFSRECKPHFIGVWDTVESVGWFWPRRFPNSRLNPDVLHGYHALSIDEQRRKFRPNLWSPPASSQTIDQTWFAGVHSDVGGWYTEAGLSNIALHWMATAAHREGLRFQEGALTEFQNRGNALDTLHNSLLPWWWLLGWSRRKIPSGASIHPSVYERMKGKPGYRPSNVPPQHA